MGYGQHNSVGKLSYEKTDGSSAFLNRFARTVFGHFLVSPSKKIWDSKNRKSDLSYLTIYLRFYQMGYGQHNSVGKPSYEKTDGSSAFLNRFARTVFGHFPVSPSKKIWDSKKSKI